MKRGMTERQLVVVFLTFVFIVGMFFGVGQGGCQVHEAHAQVGRTIEERQVIALEKIASEMGRMRRDGIKCR